MKIKAILASFFLIASAGVFAQDAIWLIADYPSLGQETQAQISERIAEGYTPVGLEAAEGVGISIMYVRTGTTDFDRWVLHEFSDPETLEAEMSEIISRGFTPAGLAAVSSGFIGLFVNAPEAADRWRLISTTPVPTDIAETLESYQEEGFTPYGISQHEGVVWFLLASYPETAPRPVFVNAYENEDVAIRNGITDQMELGWIPYGFMLSVNSITVQYVQ